MQWLAQLPDYFGKKQYFSHTPINQSLAYLVLD